jgi:hypothetical protein
MIIAIDFDGTIVRGQFPAIDGLTPDARQYINRMRADGHYIIINTCRSGQQAIDAVNYLLYAGILFDRFNDNEPTSVAKYNSNSRKVYAHVYVDDKQVGGLPPWSEIYKYITELENRYKNSI